MTDTFNWAAVIRAVAGGFVGFKLTSPEPPDSFAQVNVFVFCRCGAATD